LKASLRASGFVDALDLVCQLDVLLFEEFDVVLLSFDGLFVLVGFVFHEITDVVDLVCVFLVAVVLFGLAFLVGFFGGLL
jgi:hypothetical protein